MARMFRSETCTIQFQDGCTQHVVQAAHPRATIENPNAMAVPIVWTPASTPGLLGITATCKQVPGAAGMHYARAPCSQVGFATQ